MPKENMYYTCTACITIDNVMRIDKKIIRKFIYKNGNIGWRKTQMSRFINTKLKSDSESSYSDSQRIGAKIDKKLMAKFGKSGSDSE